MSIPSDLPPDDRGDAPTYQVPNERIVSVEHPCIVKKFNNGFKSLGGEHQLKGVLENTVADVERLSRQNQIYAGASLRPNDPFARKLKSTGVETHNVLIKVTVPKRTGRKRKRGSDEPFVDSSPQQSDVTASDLLQRLRDKPDSYTMQAVGFIEDTHRFRGLPDLQVRAEDVPVMRNLRDHAIDPNYSKLQNFYIDLKPGVDGITSFPGPPDLLPDQPYRYEFQPQIQDGQDTVTGKADRRLTVSQRIGIAIKEGVVAPQEPPVDLPEADGDAHTKALEALTKLLDKCPVVSMRAACNFSRAAQRTMSSVIQHVGYYITHGPWQETIVKYGVDPRSDPKYRFYQTLWVKLDHPRKYKDAHQRRESQSEELHIFDGKKLDQPASIWQLCDLTDPVLETLVETRDLRTECDPEKLGWYHNGTLAKIRVILSDKVDHFMHNKEQLSDEYYKPIFRLPNQIRWRAVASTKKPFNLAFPDEHTKSLAHAVEREANEDKPRFGPNRSKASPANKVDNGKVASLRGSGGPHAGERSDHVAGAQQQSLDVTNEHEQENSISDDDEDDEDVDQDGQTRK